METKWEDTHVDYSQCGAKEAGEIGPSGQLHNIQPVSHNVKMSFYENQLQKRKQYRYDGEEDKGCARVIQGPRKIIENKSEMPRSFLKTMMVKSKTPAMMGSIADQLSRLNDKP